MTLPKNKRVTFGMQPFFPVIRTHRSWWTRFCLLFCKPIRSFDPAGTGTYIVVKQFRGKLYVIESRVVNKV